MPQNWVFQTEMAAAVSYSYYHPAILMIKYFDKFKFEDKEQ